MCIIVLVSLDCTHKHIAKGLINYVILLMIVFVILERCANAFPIQNGFVVQTGVELDDTANYTCNQRYRMSPRSVSSIVCMQNGQWSHQPPRCVESKKTSC